MKRGKDSGFTLLELVIAMAVIGVMIVGLFDLFSSLRQTNRSADNLMTANEVAQQIIETYRNMPYGNISVGSQDDSSLLSSYPSLSSPRSATATVTQTDPAGLMQVDVVVSYTDRTGAKNVRLSTVIAIKGINR